MPDFGKKWTKTKMRPCAQENFARRDSSNTTILSVFVSYVCDGKNTQIVPKSQHGTSTTELLVIIKKSFQQWHQRLFIGVTGWD